MLIRVQHLFQTPWDYIHDAGIECEKNRVVQVGAWDKLFLNRSADFEYPKHVLIPGLINAHCHLEYSRLRNQIPEKISFADWLIQIVTQSVDRKIDSETWNQSCQELIQSGCTTVLDIQSQKNEYPTELRVYPFFELIGLKSENLQSRIQNAEKNLQATPEGSFLAPHALYSTHPEYFSYALKKSQKMMLHVAESESEIEFVKNHAGPIKEFLQKLSFLPQPIPTQRGDFLELLKSYGLSADNAAQWILVHGNFLSLAEMEELGRLQIPVVICPRSHAFFDHAKRPWISMINRKVPLLLGTDSLASNSQLSMHAEMLYLTDHTKLPLQEILAMATLYPAQAMGFEGLGALTVGKLADFAIYDLSRVHRENPLSALLTQWAKCVATVIDGEFAFKV